MNRPAAGLDGKRPIEMLQTVQGTEIVTDFLTRLEYDVYS
jgi:putative toxin-antitoxin system antitoxin component (TIGR02293 family)